MKIKWALFTIIFTIATVLTGCEPLMVLDPKGPQAETQANDIIFRYGLWPLSSLSLWYC